MFHPLVAGASSAAALSSSLAKDGKVAADPSSSFLDGTLSRSPSIVDELNGNRTMSSSSSSSSSNSSLSSFNFFCQCWVDEQVGVCISSIFGLFLSSRTLSIFCFWHRFSFLSFLIFPSFYFSSFLLLFLLFVIFFSFCFLPLFSFLSSPLSPWLFARAAFILLLLRVIKLVFLPSLARKIFQKNGEPLKTRFAPFVATSRVYHSYFFLPSASPRETKLRSRALKIYIRDIIF